MLLLHASFPSELMLVSQSFLVILTTARQLTCPNMSYYHRWHKYCKDCLCLYSSTTVQLDQHVGAPKVDELTV